MKEEDIPSSMETGIRVIAFDQGGIYIGVDYGATVRAFERLGVTNAHELYTQATQTPTIDKFERGQVSESVFYNYLRENLKGLRPEVTDLQLYDAWNAMLTGLVPGVLEFIRELRKHGYITIVVSNADIIHHTGVERQLEEAGVKVLFESESFDKRFISYQMGFNKPSVAMFYEVERELKEQFFIDGDILFIDDSEKHIVGRSKDEGAENAGWLGLCVPSNAPVEEFSEGLKKYLKSIAAERKASRKNKLDS